MNGPCVMKAKVTSSEMDYRLYFFPCQNTINQVLLGFADNNEETQQSSHEVKMLETVDGGLH